MKTFECPLTLVSAPNGFGKTTLLSNWIQSLPPERARIAWLSLDEGDNEPVLFWRYVLTALDRACRLSAHTTGSSAAFRPAGAHQWKENLLCNPYGLCNELTSAGEGEVAKR